MFSIEFSFSGLKTSLYYFLKKHPDLKSDPQIVANLAASYQAAIVDILVQKTQLALKMVEARSVIVGGGVSANCLLSQELTRKLSVPVHFPPLKLSGDNAVGVGLCASYNFRPVALEKVVAQPTFRRF